MRPALAALILAGCASTAIPLNQARPVSMTETYRLHIGDRGAAEVTVVRDTGLIAGGCKTVLAVDAVPAAILSTGERATLPVSLGAHTLLANSPGCWPGDLTELRFTATQGMRMVVRLQTTTDGYRFIVR